MVVVGIMDFDGSLVDTLIAAVSDPAAFYGGWFVVPSRTAVTILLTWSAFQLALMRLVPGKTYHGPVTPAGNVPVYTANGFQCFAITIVTYLLAVYHFKLFDPTLVYDHYKEMLAALQMFSWPFCLLLYFKGLYAPSSTDCGSNGNFLMDYYWGTELYPRILGFDVKMFTNCRFGMMAWAVLPLALAAKSQALHGSLSWALVVNITLQLVYCAKVCVMCVGVGEEEWWERVCTADGAQGCRVAGINCRRVLKVVGEPLYAHACILFFHPPPS